MIQPLPLLAPDEQRGEQTISRCHERLAHVRRARADGNTTYLAVERVLVGGLCLIYMSGVALAAIQMLSVDR